MLILRRSLEAERQIKRCFNQVVQSKCEDISEKSTVTSVVRYELVALCTGVGNEKPAPTDSKGIEEILEYIVALEACCLLYKRDFCHSSKLLYRS